MTDQASTDSDRELPTDDELRQRLTPMQYEVTQNAATERPFTGIYHDTKAEGTYRCVVCGDALFSSDAKYDSGSGWPSFYEALSSEKIVRKEDHSYGMLRTEAICGRCGAHLGHIFPDGPRPTGERYCMNSAALDLEPSTDDD